MLEKVYRIAAIQKSGERIHGTLTLGNETPQLAQRVHLIYRLNDKSYSREGEDYFMALSEIRRALEDEGLLLDCYGASKNVSLAPWSSETSLGAEAYKLTLRRPVFRAEDQVLIFETGPGVEPATREAQKKHHRLWLESLGWEFDMKGKVVWQGLEYDPFYPPFRVRMQWEWRDRVARMRQESSGGFWRAIKSLFTRKGSAK